MKRRALFCWEIGEGSGHVGPYLSLLGALAARDWEVWLALRNTSAADAATRARWPVFQAPVCLNEFSGISSQPANHTELFLGFGFAHADTLAGLAQGWRALFDAWRPDLVIANNSPVALLAAHGRRVPAIRVGTGFECPPGGSRPPLLVPWHAELEPRLERAEALALRNANSVLREMGATALESLSTALHDVPTLLATVPAFDEFPKRTGKFEYVGPFADDPAGRVRPAQAVEVFAYLRVQHARTGRRAGCHRRIRKACLRVSSGRLGSTVRFAFDAAVRDSARACGPGRHSSRRSRGRVLREPLGDARFVARGQALAASPRPRRAAPHGAARRGIGGGHRRGSPRADPARVAPV